MQTLTLRWALWSILLALCVLVNVGLSRFFVPPYETIPLKSVARYPPIVEEVTYGHVGRMAMSSALMDAEPPAVLLKTDVGRRGLTRAVAGMVSDFPALSVTHLPSIEVYLVRTTDGFVALWGRDSDWRYETFWDPRLRRFVEPRRGTAFTMTGECWTGPCFHDLGRYAVEVDDERVVIDLGARLVHKYDPRSD
jgi:hypothetical protein